MLCVASGESCWRKEMRLKQSPSSFAVSLTTRNVGIGWASSNLIAEIAKRHGLGGNLLLTTATLWL